MKDMDLLIENLLVGFTKFKGLLFGTSLSIKGFQKAQELLIELERFLTKVQIPMEPLVKEVLTYEAAIQYFVESNPSISSVEKEAILRQQHSQGQTILQVFLNKKNELVCMPQGKPYGRRLIVQKLDAELSEAFGDTDLIIVE